MIAKPFPLQFPHLENERLVLRQPKAEDEEAIFRSYADEEIARHIMQPVKTRAEANEILQSFINDFYTQERIFWVIALKGTENCIGTCCYETFHTPGVGEIGYDLARQHWGRGYMQEALQTIIQFGFETLGLHEIEAFTTVGNLRSQRVLQKLGFQFAGEHGGEYRFTLELS